MHKIDYYFDFLSPYSYFSWINLQKLTQNIDVQINYKPVVLAKLLNSVDLKGPGEIESKREFLLRQCFRYAHKNAIPFTVPKSHPFNPLYALRLATLSCAQNEQWKIIDLLWKAAWQERQDLSDPDYLLTLLNSHQLSGEELLERSFQREVKNELKQNIDEAIQFGAFGVPTFNVDGEFFWGNDSLPDIYNKLMGKDDWDKKTYEAVLANTPRGMGAQKLQL